MYRVYGGFIVVWVYYPSMEPQQLDKVDTVTADERGRVTIGVEFADEDVKVYVERVEGDS